MDTVQQQGMKKQKNAKPAAPSTVGRKKNITISQNKQITDWKDELTNLYFGSSLDMYDTWPEPQAIISDGAYGILGFEGDTTNHLDLPTWYEPHIRQWSTYATPQTTLWFWNTEIGWASVHPVLEKYGWRYISASIWNKGKGHIAGNTNTKSLRRFPVVTEICVQYTLEARIEGLTLKEWLLKEWKRTGLPLRAANTACGVADAATRKYFNQGHLWYFPPPEKFALLVKYANTYGDSDGKPYFCLSGTVPGTSNDWGKMRPLFKCPYGVTNVWDIPPLRSAERIKTQSGKAVHLNQKPLEIMTQIIQASTDEHNVIWEPFGGLFSAALAARFLKRRAYAAELDQRYFDYGKSRFEKEYQTTLDL